MIPPGFAATVMLGIALAPSSFALTGINVHVLDPGLASSYAQAGFGVVRYDLAWSRVEKTPGRYDWSADDAFVSALRAHGITPLLVLGYGNDLYDGGLAPHTPEGRTAFARFAALAARRYPGAIFEIWNEPNIPWSWKPAPDPEAYVQLVAETAAAIRRAADDTRTHTPVLGLSLGGGSFDESYVVRAFRAGLLDHVDAVAIHPYAAAEPEEMPALYARIRGLMGREERPLVVTEWGHACSLTSEAGQARRLVEFLGVNARLGIDLTVLYEWQDEGDDPGNPQDHYGLLRCDGSPKPAYQAVMEALCYGDGESGGRAGHPPVVRVERGPESPRWSMVRRSAHPEGEPPW
jgi:hypothetical protein